MVQKPIFPLGEKDTEDLPIELRCDKAITGCLGPRRLNKFGVSVV